MPAHQGHGQQPCGKRSAALSPPAAAWTSPRRLLAPAAPAPPVAAMPCLWRAATLLACAAGASERGQRAPNPRRSATSLAARPAGGTSAAAREAPGGAVGEAGRRRCRRSSTDRTLAARRSMQACCSCAPLSPRSPTCPAPAARGMPSASTTTASCWRRSTTWVRRGGDRCRCRRRLLAVRVRWVSSRLPASTPPLPAAPDAFTFEAWVQSTDSCHASALLSYALPSKVGSGSGGRALGAAVQQCMQHRGSCTDGSRCLPSHALQASDPHRATRDFNSLVLFDPRRLAACHDYEFM